MASNPSLPSNQDDDVDEEEESEEEEDEDEDDVDDFDPDAEAFSAAVSASLAEAEAAADRDPPEVEIFEVPPDQEADQDQRDEEEEDEENEEEDEGEAKGKGKGGCGSQSDRLASPNCPICLEPWTSDGPHRVCCIPCGHVYGRSCLEKWLQRCRKSDGKCPLCNRKFKHKEIINLYAHVIVIPNDVLEKEVRSLRENNETLPWSCIPCGHVYGRSCLEKWLQRCRKSDGKCPQCNKKFKHKEIINLYAPVIVIPNDVLEKEVRSLRENNETLTLENFRLQEEIKKHKMHLVNSESSGRQKMLCLDRATFGGSQRRLCAYFDERLSSPVQTLSENRFISQSFCQDESRRCNFVLQKEFRIDGARVMGIDASSQILIISGKAPGVSGDYVLNKISLLGPNEIDNVHLPSNTGVVRDMRILPDGLVLLASLGKRLSLFSVTSKNCVLKYDLPGPAWSCSGDLHNPYHVYAGLQNGMLLVFDLRQTSRNLYSMDGLSRHPVHTIHSVMHLDNTSKVITASSAGPCVWDVGCNGERPFLIPGMDNYGICISLACCSSTDDLVASFRPKVELSNDTMSSQTSLSPSPTLSGSGRLGSHVLIKRANGASYESHSIGTGNVSEVRMSKSAIISTEGNNPLFACGDELSRRVCLWNLPQLHVHSYLRPHPQPILDLKYARAAGPGFLGCISEDMCQLFTCF